MTSEDKVFHFLYSFNFIYQSREILDSLRKVGFRLNNGLLGTGLLFLSVTSGSGYYIGLWISPPRTEFSQVI